MMVVGRTAAQCVNPRVGDSWAAVVVMVRDVGVDSWFHVSPWILGLCQKRHASSIAEIIAYNKVSTKISSRVGFDVVRLPP